MGKIKEQLGRCSPIFVRISPDAMPSHRFCPGGAGNEPGARFSKVPIINGPGKLSPFALKIEVSIVLHLA